MNYTFKAINGFCPYCIAHGRYWYILDRHVGGDSYNYCLMSKTTDEPWSRKFKDIKELAAWINDTSEDISDNSTAYYIINRSINYRYSYDDVAMIEKDGVRYRYEKKDCIITEMHEARQETGWFERYRDCLAVAKQILRENEECKQMSLFE